MRQFTRNKVTSTRSTWWIKSRVELSFYSISMAYAHAEVPSNAFSFRGGILTIVVILQGNMLQLIVGRENHWCVIRPSKFYMINVKKHCIVPNADTDAMHTVWFIARGCKTQVHRMHRIQPNLMVGIHSSFLSRMKMAIDALPDEMTWVWSEVLGFSRLIWSRPGPLKIFLLSSRATTESK